MERIEVPFLGPTTPGRGIKQNPQLTRNLYPQIEGYGSTSVIGLYSDPGLINQGSAGTGPWRSNFVEWNGLLYGVSNNELYSINGAVATALIGTLQTSSGRVSLAAGRSYLGLVDGLKGYSYDGGTFAEITDADFPDGATHIDWIDGYFVVNHPSNGAYQISALDDATDWDPLDTKNAESNPDKIDALVTTENLLYLMGAETTEIHVNTGNADFPFERFSDQGIIESGVAAPHSVVKSPVGVFMLAQNEDGDAYVVRLRGPELEVISDPYVEWAIGEFSAIADATSFIYRQRGRWYYVLNFAAADKTFVYSLREKMWYERKSFGKGRHRAEGHGFINRRQLVGDDTNGNIYELDFDTFDDAGSEHERLRRAQVIDAQQRELVHHELVVNMKTGVGNVGVPDPDVKLRYSDDGGETWSSTLTEKLGASGATETRVAFSQLGTSRSRVYELSVTDAVDCQIFEAYLLVEPAEY